MRARVSAVAMIGYLAFLVGQTLQRLHLGTRLGQDGVEPPLLLVREPQARDQALADLLRGGPLRGRKPSAPAGDGQGSGLSGRVPQAPL